MNYEGVLRGLGVILVTAAVVVLGFVLARGGNRFWAYSALIVIAVSFFGQGTRRLALMPLLVAFGAYAGANENARRRYKAGIGFAAVAGIYLLRLPLFLRGLQSHGVVPYFESLPDFLSSSTSFDVLLKNVLISFPIIGYTAFAVDRIPLGDFWVSINPAPGNVSGWYDIASQHRINIYTPYAAVGEVANLGIGPFIIFFALWGVVLAALDLRVQALVRSGHNVFALAIVGFCALFFLYLIQYNLRSATRLIYYAAILALLPVASFQEIRRNRLFGSDQ